MDDNNTNDAASISGNNSNDEVLRRLDATNAGGSDVLSGAPEEVVEDLDKTLAGMGLGSDENGPRELGS